MFTEVTGIPAPKRGDDYVADVVIDQVFAEVWTRPGLTRKEPVAMEAHFGAALATGEISMDELREFVIHLAAYAGHPRATAARASLDAAWERISEHELGRG